MLETLSRMPGVAPNDAALIQAVTRAAIEGRLSEARMTEEQTGQPARFVTDEPGEG